MTQYGYLAWDDADLTEREGAHLWALVIELHYQVQAQGRSLPRADVVGMYVRPTFAASQAVCTLVQRARPQIRWQLVNAA